jgi:hypothetical protein
MNRLAASAYLSECYAELLNDAKFSTQQTTDALNGAIDMSLRQLGFDESVLASADVGQADTLAYLALLNYYALKRFATLLAIRFDVNISGAVSAQRSQAFDRVRILMEEAAIEVQRLGFDVGGTTTGFELGRLTLDFLEPSTGNEFAWLY